MYSKIAVRLCIVICALNMSCSRESEIASPPIEPDLKGSASCLTHIDQNLSSYTAGKMSRAQVESFWNCAAKAVQDFQRLTSGGERQGDHYAPQAVRRFFQRYFVHTSMSDRLLASFMEVKRVFLSGNSQEITRTELVRLYELLLLARDVSVDLNPHVRVLFMRNKTATDQEIEDASEALRKSLFRIGEWLGRHKQSYSFDQLEDLVDELDKRIEKTNDQVKLFADVKKGLKVLRPAKQVFLAGKPDIIEGEKWTQLTAAIADSYSAILSFHYSLAYNLMDAAVRQTVPRGFLRLADALERAVSAHGGEIPMTEFFAVIDRVAEGQWLPTNCTAAAMRLSWSWFLKRPLTIGGNGAEVSGMTEPQVQTLRKYMGQWNRLYDLIRGEIRSRATLAQNFQAVIDKSPPMQWDSENRIYFPSNPDAQWTVDGRAHMVWSYMLITWLRDAYMGPGVDNVNGDQMEAGAVEFLPVLQAYNFIREVKPSVGQKLRREGDLFTLSSSGEESLEVHEAVRYLAMVGSAFRVAEMWMDSAKAQCPDEDAACVRAFGANPANHVLDSMPQLNEWLNAKGPAFFTDFTLRAEETVLGKRTVGPFTEALLLQVMMIFHYVETFERRYDKSLNGMINLAESKIAYPVFRPTLGGLLRDKGFPEEQVLPFYTYLFRYGDIPIKFEDPTTAPLGWELIWFHWQLHPDKWEYESDRDHLLSILYQLSKMVPRE